MRIFAIVFAFFVSCFHGDLSAQAARSGGASDQTIKFVADLPEVLEIDETGWDNKRPKLGFRHDRFAIMGMPLGGSQKGTFVLYTETATGFRYSDLTPTMVTAMSALLGQDLANTQQVSPLELYWGWLIFGPLAMLAFFKKLLAFVAKRSETSYRSNEPDIAEPGPLPPARARMATAARPAGGPVTFGRRT